MNETETRPTGLGADFPGPQGQRVLRLLLPAGRREEFVGDLIEEAETVVLPRRGRAAALRWFWWQAATSASPMHARRCAREVGMHRQRWIVLIAFFVLGTVMALDSGIADGSASVIALVALAIAVPAGAGLLSGNLRIHAAAAVVSMVILLVARLLSGIELRWYAMSWVFFVLLVTNWLYEHRRLVSGGDDGQSGPTAAA